MQKKHKRYAAWKAPFLAFFCKDFYADVAYNWTGTGIRYMVAMVSLSWLIAVTLTVALPCVRILCDRGLQTFCQQVPKITLCAGQLSINKSYPYAIKDSAGDTVVLFVADSELPKKELPPIIISKNSLIMEVPGAGPKSCRFDALAGIKTDLAIDVESIFSTIKMVLPWLPIICLIVGTPIVLLLHLMQMVVYGCVAKVIARICKKQITYKTGLRLAAVAITPAIVCSTTIVVLTFLLFPLRFVHLLIVYAPMHSWAVHHPFAVASVVSAISYLILAAISLDQENCIEFDAGKSPTR